MIKIWIKIFLYIVVTVLIFLVFCLVKLEIKLDKFQPRSALFKSYFDFSKNKSNLHDEVKKENESNNSNYRQRCVRQTLTKINSTNTDDEEDNDDIQYYVKIGADIYPKFIPLPFNKSIDFDCVQRNNPEIKRILAWNSFFGDFGYSFKLGVRTPFIDRKCPITNCELTSDRSLINRSDYVLVHMRDTIDNLPKLPNQRWIFILYESPVHSGDFTHFNDFFNLTSTYTIDSDFPLNFDFLKWERPSLTSNSNGRTNDVDSLQSKIKFSVALISNCGGSSNRLRYIREMRNYVGVDIFGGCGNRCPEKFKNGSRGKCRDIISHEYKFFLSFENSLCKGYVTEKFFLQHKYDIIPVVMGHGFYDYYVPKSAYIDTNDFSSVKHLTDYLIYLSTNSTAYKSYFEWKRHVRIFDEANFIPLCDMCIKLNLETIYGVEKKVISNIGDYWSKSLNCKIDPN